EREAFTVVLIDHSLVEKNVHHSEGKGCIGARYDREMLVALLSGEALVWIDCDKLRTTSPGLNQSRPEMDIGGHGIGAPKQDQASILELLEVCSDGSTDSCLVSCSAGR